MLLIMMPAMMTAVGVVREKELGSITNLYVTPVTRWEFLLGKQMSYVVLRWRALSLDAGRRLRVPRAGQGQLGDAGLGALFTQARPRDSDC